MLTHLFSKITTYLNPSSCTFCKIGLDSLDLFCQECYKELPWLENPCLFCCRPLPDSASAKYCGKCLNKPPHYDRAFSLFRYATPLTQLIPALKFHQQLQYIRILGKLLASSINTFYANERPDYIIAVPLHKKRLRERGYNQALEIAKIIRKDCGLPLVRNICQRIRYTQPQSSLDVKNRKKNVKNAFRIHPQFSANHILLIDDVMTTGQTLNELSRAFKKQGVTKIDVWSLAKTVKE